MLFGWFRKQEPTCNHEWEVLSESITKSKYEIAIESLGEKVEGRVSMPAQFCDVSRKHIQCFTCSKCGKFKRFVEEI